MFAFPTRIVNKLLDRLDTNITCLDLEIIFPYLELLLHIMKEGRPLTCNSQWQNWTDLILTSVQQNMY